MLFGLADRNDQPRIGGENLADPLRGEVFEAQGTGVKSRGIRVDDELAVAGTAAVLGLWLLQPSLIWALAAFGLGAAGALFATRAKDQTLLVAAVLGLVGATSAGVRPAGFSLSSEAGTVSGNSSSSMWAASWA